MTVSVSKYIATLDKKRQENIRKRAEILILQELYPDLDIVQERGHEYYTSKFINSEVDNYVDVPHVGHLLIRCFKKTQVNGMDVFVYADPLYIDIGRSYEYVGGGDLNYDWKESLRKYNISEAVITKIEKDYNEEEISIDETE